MNIVKVVCKLVMSLLLLSLTTTISFGQGASSIELTGSNASLSAIYNVETIVDPNLIITANGTINGFRVQISESYSTGDILTYTGTLPSGITQSWSATTGVLSFSGSGTAQQWQDILRLVKFKSTNSVCYPTARSIAFTAGTVYYNPLTGHFYEYVVLSPAQGWSYSKTNAESRSYFGRIGYMATFSSAAENNFVWKIMANDGWFGASDDYLFMNAALGTNTYASQAASENKWSWVCGPEAGTQFSNGSTAVNGQYANWNGGEPNNSGGEHYGQFYSGSQGRWNDLRSTHTLGGYLCEFGGMPNDNTDYTPFFTRNVTVSGSSTGTITGGGVNVCTGTNSTTLTITNFTGSVVRWESSPDNFLATVNNITSTSTSYVVSNITQTTYYRAVVNSTSPNVCNGQVSSSVPIYVTPTIAGNITAANNTICAGGDVELTLSGNQGNVNKWQWSSNNGSTWTDVANTTTFLTQTIASAGTYLFRAEVQTPGCGAAVNTSNKTITVISGTPPDGGAVSSASYCGGSNSGTLILSGYSGTISTWQRSTDGGIVWTDIASTAGLTSYGFSAISSNTLYRVKVTNGSCGNAYSSVGAVEVFTTSVAGNVTGTQTVCGGSGITNISLSGNTGTIQWTSSTNNSVFTNISGATESTLSQANLPANITQTTYYRATITNGACAAVNSNTITATYNAPVTYYQDSDADGYGKDNVTQSVCTGQPTGYTTQGGDCNDLNAAVKPSASETCNLIDDNCNGSIDEGVQTTFYVDYDGDGYGNPAVPVLACTQPTGYVNNSNDFNDNNPNAYNGAPELCDGIDNDGDALIDEGVQNTYYADSDGDGYGDINVPGLACSQPLNYVANSNDCNDLNVAINPNASETCNEVDDDCDTAVDEGVQTTYYVDSDGDGYGNVSVTQGACSQPSGYVSNSTDCNDNNANVNLAATEICNTIDDDCDNSIDENVQTIYFLDADGDGFGTSSTTTLACSAPANYVSNSQDCNDGDLNIYPGANEVCNGIDDDCDGVIENGLTFVDYFVDADGDGYGAGTASNLCADPGADYVTNDNDCDDAAVSIFPGGVETCNLIDDDCDGEVDEYVTTTYYQDVDGDGFGDLNVTVEACATPANFVLDNSDCDDAELTYQDNDGDGFGNTVEIACGVFNNTDCNDNDAALNSITTEVCNNFDDDCDGTADDGLTFVNYYVDADGDGYGAGAASNLCSNPGAGYVTNNTDCNDNNATLNSITTEVCNNFDDDCDGTADDGLTFVNYYLDSDGDGYGAGAASNLCSNPGAGYVTNNTDCNDNNATLNSITTEVCNNFDDDCDGTADDGLTFVNYYVDNDGDGYGAGAASNLCSNPGAGFVTNNTDCNDNNATLNSITAEVCNNFDDDCDGTADDGLTFINYYVDTDGDGYGAGAASNLCSNPGAGYVTNNTDCNDNNATLNSITTEVCNNFDDDCDGTADDGLTFVNYYVDTDGDGYGAGAASNLCSNPGAGYVTNNTDCNDNNASLNSITAEVCNNFDDDCDGTADDGLTFVNYYVDNDGDGYGAGAASNLCSNPGAGYVTNNTDCNDNNPSLNSITVEVCNNFDDDCDGSVDNGLTFVNYYIDADGDGYGAGAASNLCANPGAGYVTNNTDCNDNNASLNSITVEVCNNFDDDCDGSVDNGLTFVNYYIDADGDGYGAGSASNLCSNPGAGYSTNADDCDDAVSTTYPGATEACNDVDDDCNGLVDNDIVFTNYYADADGDGYGAGDATSSCSDLGAGFVTNNTDCNDADGNIYPTATETCNYIDDNCDGNTDEGVTTTYYEDLDADGYGNLDVTIQECGLLNGYSENGLDCNDADGNIYPGATEICNTIDDNCDGEVDEFVTTTFYADNDGDGFGDVSSTVQSCTLPMGYLTNADDCDDSVITYEDLDGDGYGTTTIVACGVLSANDCDDAVSTTYPGATEACNDVDDDCNGAIDNDIVFTNYYADVDGDGYGAGDATSSCSDLGAGFVTNNTDCNDADGNIYPTATETCNYIDDNCDGNTDEGVTTTYYEDLDADGYGNLDVTIQECGLLNGYSENGLDCNDENGSIYPTATEICNTIDDNCDGEVDEFVTTTFYADNDGDGFGFAESTTESCELPLGYVTNADDCDDSAILYEDLDGDGFGTTTVVACGVLSANDCDDAISTVYPGATEACDNGVDEDCDGSDVTCIYLGCTDVVACNYNASANTDDGSCTYPTQSYLNCDGTCINDTDADGVCNEIEVAGCTDATACNYNANATDEDNTCTYPAQSYLNCDGTCINDTDADGVCNEVEVAGCTDATACNYNANATDEDNTCTYPAQSYLNCDGTCINDTDADGVCNEIEVAGCTDATACNYNANATDEDNTCTYPTQSYLNCDGTCINDTDADGVCNEIEVAGCTDATACNYNASATDEDNTCTYPTQSYLNCDGTCINDTDADGVCNEIEVAGCTDVTACNYNASATDEDNTCTYPAQSYLNCDGTCINDTDADGVCNEIEVAGCTDATACNYNASATDEDNTCTYPTQLYLNCDGTCINDTDADGVCNEIEVAGCTDATACNYNANATDDNGTCILPVAEICNLLDDDCDGETDEFVTTTYFADVDADGYGDANNAVEACSLPTGYVLNNTDCDDNAITYLDADSDGFGTSIQVDCGVYNNSDCNDGTALIQPNANEICNEVDDNCNGTIDEGVQNAYYADADGDGFGDVNALLMACTMPAGFVTNTEDCDDTQWTYLDVDQDGYGVGNPIACGANNNLDCNDINSSMNPGAVEICNGIDDNCSGVIDEGLLTTYYIDVDADGYGDPNNMIDACTQPNGFVLDNTDCNDAASWANPMGVEVCNGVDDNCDGVTDEGVQLTFYADTDGDGFGNINDSLWSCAQPDGYIDNTLDCDDTQPTVFEGATEIYDGLDNNCNGIIDEGFEFIPDAFSPNQDGDYDYFVIDRLLSQEHVAIKVFNRWGGLVYEAADYQNDWNGFSNVGGHSGEEMAVGTYYYEIELQFSKKTYSGYITLWR